MGKTKNLKKDWIHFQNLMLYGSLKNVYFFQIDVELFSN